MSIGYPLPGITVNPGVGKSMSVNIQTNTPVSATATVYSDRYGVSAVTLPTVITAPTTFYVPNPGTWVVNGQPVTVEGTQVGYVNNAASLNGTVFAPPPTGVAATDMANVQNAINSVPNATGIVQLQGGKYAFASTLRTDTVSTFTNTSAATMAITMAVTGAVDGQISWVQIYDFSAASETIGWTNTENSTVSAPTTSNGSTTLPKTVQFMFNGGTSKWRCILSA